MGKGRGKKTLGANGSNSPLSRKDLRNGHGGHGPGGQADPLAQKRELLKKLREKQ